jgi:hypothetical protein
MVTTQPSQNEPLHSAQILNYIFIFYQNIGTDRFCEFKPFQLIPYSHEEPATQFISSSTIFSCFLYSHANSKAQAKFPNNTKEMDLQWLDESYVNFTVSNNKLYFKVLKSTVMLASLTFFRICFSVSSSGDDQFQVCEAQ